MPLVSLPGAHRACNHQSALGNDEFVCEEVSKLVKCGCIKVVISQPYVRSPLSVVQSSMGKKRLVVNLRYLNQFLWKQRFRYEDLRTALLLFQPGDHAFTFDLKSGYHHVDIYEPHQKFLGCEWHAKFCQFTVLPFGLSTACYIFTKLMRALVKYWRSCGIRVVMFLDDGIGMDKGEMPAIQASNVVQKSLRRAGFLDHPEKCMWTPSTKISWLGFHIDLVDVRLQYQGKK